VLRFAAGVALIHPDPIISGLALVVSAGLVALHISVR
jgi:hypothetical protein